MPLSPARRRYTPHSPRRKVWQQLLGPAAGRVRRRLASRLPACGEAHSAVSSCPQPPCQQKVGGRAGAPVQGLGGVCVGRAPTWAGHRGRQEGACGCCRPSLARAFPLGEAGKRGARVCVGWGWGATKRRLCSSSAALSAKPRKAEPPVGLAGGLPERRRAGRGSARRGPGRVGESPLQLARASCAQGWPAGEGGRPRARQAPPSSSAAESRARLPWRGGGGAAGVQLLGAPGGRAQQPRRRWPLWTLDSAADPAELWPNSPPVPLAAAPADLPPQPDNLLYFQMCYSSRVGRAWFFHRYHVPPSWGL